MILIYGVGFGRFMYIVYVYSVIILIDIKRLTYIHSLRIYSDEMPAGAGFLHNGFTAAAFTLRVICLFLFNMFGVIIPKPLLTIGGFDFLKVCDVVYIRVHWARVRIIIHSRLLPGLVPSILFVAVTDLPLTAFSTRTCSEYLSAIADLTLLRMSQYLVARFPMLAVQRPANIVKRCCGTSLAPSETGFYNRPHTIGALRLDA